MSSTPTKTMRNVTRYLTLGLLAASGLALAQEPETAPPPADSQQQQQPATRGWRHFGDPPPANQADQANPQTNPSADAPNQAADRDQQGAAPPDQSSNQPPPDYQPEQPVPARLTIKPGTYFTVRVNQPLSSDHNQAGDAFTASLVRPIVVDGVVVAQTGQIIGGRVAEAQKAGRVSGTSKLGLQLTDLTLVDGQQLPIQSQLITRNGTTSQGRDAAAIAGTTGVGAAVGAAADWGRGAAIGAGAGAVAGIVGVLLTRGHPTEVYPEQVLTFRIEAPVTVATDRAPQAFRYVQPGDYNRAPSVSLQRPPARPAYPAPAPYYYAPGYYPYPYYPYYWGPSIGLYFGGGYWGRGWGGWGYRGFHR